MTPAEKVAESIEYISLEYYPNLNKVVGSYKKYPDNKKGLEKMLGGLVFQILIEKDLTQEELLKIINDVIFLCKFPNSKNSEEK